MSKTLKDTTPETGIQGIYDRFKSSTRPVISDKASDWESAYRTVINETNLSATSTEEVQEQGLINKYNVTHVDGSPIDVGAQYFVLRIDPNQNRTHYEACMAALQTYSNEIKQSNPALSDDLNIKHIYPWSDNKCASNMKSKPKVVEGHQTDPGKENSTKFITIDASKYLYNLPNY